jgi:hypothetical protein
MEVKEDYPVKISKCDDGMDTIGLGKVLERIGKFQPQRI